MPRFTYVALDARGQESTGLMEANSSNEVIGHLRQAGYFPTSVYEEGKGGPDGRVARATAKPRRAATPRAKGNIVLFERKTVKPKILMIFTRQLATLVDAGLPLLRGTIRSHRYKGNNSHEDSRSAPRCPFFASARRHRCRGRPPLR